MDAQEMFDKVAMHLMQQGTPATVKFDGDPLATCRYRTEDGLSCAVGCLISDKMYDPKMEGLSVKSICLTRPRLTQHLGISNLDMLMKLQQIHDETYPAEWPEELMAVAIAHDLEISDELNEAFKRFTEDQP